MALCVVWPSESKRFLAALQSVDRKPMAVLNVHHSFLFAQQMETSAQKSRNIQDSHREFCNTSDMSQEVILI